MIISLVEMIPRPDDRQAMLEILQFVHRGLEGNPSCISSGIFQGLDQDKTIFYVEQWDSSGSFHNHIRSSLYLPLLNAMDLAQAQPVVSFHEVAKTLSMELVQALRTTEEAPE
jgi:quinol monooxygenase YgiN